MKLILNTNYVVVLQDFEKAVLAGYYFVPGSSDLVIHPTGLLEVELYKQELEIPKVGFDDALDIVLVSTHDKTLFMLEIQKYIASGWRIDLNSIYFDAIGSKTCKLIHPEHPVSKVYTKEELDTLDFEELKSISRLRGCFNRQRSVLVSNVLNFQKDRE